ncbi:hypothetical protein WP50_26745, partial [Lactiplantibacillus plantarum]
MKKSETVCISLLLLLFISGCGSSQQASQASHADKKHGVSVVKVKPKVITDKAHKTNDATKATSTSVAYAFRRVVNTGSMQFSDFINQFAAITNLILIFNLLTLLLTILTGTGNFSGMTGLFFFMIPTIGIMNLAFVNMGLHNIINNDINKCQIHNPDGWDHK